MMQISIRKYLSMCLTYLIIAGNTQVIFANNIDERSAIVSEIIASLNYSHLDLETINELSVKIYDLLNERHSKNDVLNIIMNSTESEEFYRRKNTQARLNNYFFVAQIALAACVAAGLCYLAYKLGNMFNLPGFWSSQGTSGNLKKSGNCVLSPNQNSSSVQSNSLQAQSSEELAKHLIAVDELQQQENIICASSVQIQPRSDQSWTFIRGEYLLDSQLQDAVGQQLEHAKNIGFEFPGTQLNELDNSENKRAEDNRSLLQLIIEQIESAQGIGVELVHAQ